MGTCHFGTLSFRQLISYLIEDSRRRRTFMNKSTTPLGLFAGLFSHIAICIAIYRLSHYFFCKRIPILPKMLYVLNIIVFGVDISPMSQIGPGFVMLHIVATAIHAKIGKNAFLYARNGIGGSGGDTESGWFGGPIIGDNLIMHPAAVILKPITIGNNVEIGAMSLVVKDIPDNKVVVGMPGRIIGDRGSEARKVGE